MDLIIRMTGKVVESNFDEYKNSIIEVIESSQRDLVTDDDFAWADTTVKDFKNYEIALKAAKEAALQETKDIAAMFSAVDEISAQLAKTRLFLEKQIKVEKEKRKARLIEEAKEGIYSAIKSALSPETYFGAEDIELNSVVIEAAAAGKKTLEGMRKSLAVVSSAEIDCKLDMIAAANKNMETILAAEKEYPGLFHDKKELAWKSEIELSAIIDARVSQFKYQQKLKEEKEAKKAETQPEKTAVQVQPFTDLPTETPPFSEAPSAAAVSDFVFTVRMRCGTEQAKDLAKQVAERFENHPFIVSFNLSRA